MKDRRNYGRFLLTLPVLVVKEGCPAEVSAQTIDFSEKGVSFCFSDEDYQLLCLQTGDDICFQFLDSFLFGNKQETVLLSESAHVEHINRQAGGYCVGCSVFSERYAAYVVRRHVALLAERKKIS